MGHTLMDNRIRENVTKEPIIVTRRDPRRKCPQSLQSVTRRKVWTKKEGGCGKEYDGLIVSYTAQRHGKESDLLYDGPDHGL
jgi:hypothetical protein